MERLEDLQDIADADAVKDAIAKSEDEMVPATVINRLENGERVGWVVALRIETKFQ